MLTLYLRAINISKSGALENEPIAHPLPSIKTLPYLVNTSPQMVNYTDLPPLYLMQGGKSSAMSRASSTPSGHARSSGGVRV